MHIRVDNSDQTGDLLDFLRKAGCIAVRLDEHLLDVHLPDSISDEAERLELGVYVSSWGARHPEAETKFVG